MNYLPGSGSLCVWWLGTCEPTPPPVNSVLDSVFPWARCSTRLRNAFERTGDPPETFGEMVRFGRHKTNLMRNLGDLSLAQLDEIMERHGLGENWYNS